MTVFSNHLRAHGNFPDLGFTLAEKLPCALKWLEKTVILGGEKAKI
jgi:hypothetical protein